MTLVLRAFLQVGVSGLIWGGLLFWAAGTFYWTRAWLHLGLWILTLAVNLAVLLRWNRAVLAARLKPKRISMKPDKIILPLLLPAVLAVPVIAGLDAMRYQWFCISSLAIYPGIALHITGDVFLLWAMLVNPYLEKTVRIQAERGHRVITTGPYAFVRHPMYAGVILMFCGIPLVLGALWAFVPVGLTSLALIIRTIFEERMLRRELPGYEAYTRQTRCRLLPGVW
jgi:protein-S-isoprenylcysteine O-methyltransferase Ste14